MTNKIKSFGKIFGFIALFLFCYFFFLPFTPLLIGGVFVQGVLGKVTGKVGPVVFGIWKGINYGRGYVVPANPQSTDQVTQRTRFTVIQEYVRQVLATLVHGYWNQYQIGQSGYNAIMSNWMLNADVNNLLVAACKAAKGTLASIEISDAQYTTGTGELLVQWDPTLSGNMLATDKAKVLVFNKNTGLLYFLDSTIARSVMEATITVPTGITPSNLEVFLFFAQGSGSSMIVSDSTHYVAVAA